jgi:polyisoprenoid-binding protein YceI
MKKLILFIAVLMTAIASQTSAQTLWTADKAHSKIGFTITHLMITDVDGSFRNFDSKITTSKDDFSDAVVELSADANSVSTDNDQRDGHLKGPDFFDVEKFPKMTFKSTSVKKVAANKFKVAGNLTLHGVTKAVVLDAVLRGVTVNPMSKKSTAGFKVTGTLKRADFNFGAKYPGAMLSDEILLNANTEFVKN